MGRYLVWSSIVALALSATACKEEGPAERAGRKLDEAIDSLRDAGDGPAERLGERFDEAMESAQEAIDEAAEDVRKAAEEVKESAQR